MEVSGAGESPCTDDPHEHVEGQGDEFHLLLGELGDDRHRGQVAGGSGVSYGGVQDGQRQNRSGKQQLGRDGQAGQHHPVSISADSRSEAGMRIVVGEDLPALRGGSTMIAE